MRKRTEIPEDIGDYVYYDNGSLRWSGRIRGVKAGSEVGRVSRQGYRRFMFRYTSLMAHRVIYFLHTGEQPDHLDHINRDKTDNRIENLRESGHTDNSKNRNLAVTNTSGWTGITWVERRQKWQVYITVDKKYKYLGSFKDKGDAIKCRLEAENKHGWSGHNQSQAA